MDNSECLLRYAMSALDEANVHTDKWAVGGGTVLKLIFNHRESKDIDIFINDAQFLGCLSPRFNNITENALDYDETANYITLTYPEGKVDFINSSQITLFTPIQKEFLGENIFVEDPVEIICKKIYHRGKQVLPRDVFDLAVVYNSERKNDLLKASVKIKSQVEDFIKSFYKCKQSMKQYSVSYEDMLLENGIKLKGKEFNICQAYINHIRTKFKELDNKQQKCIR